MNDPKLLHEIELPTLRASNSLEEMPFVYYALMVAIENADIDAINKNLSCLHCSTDLSEELWSEVVIKACLECHEGFFNSNKLDVLCLILGKLGSLVTPKGNLPLSVAALTECLNVQSERVLGVRTEHCFSLRYFFCLHPDQSVQARVKKYQDCNRYRNAKGDGPRRLDLIRIGNISIADALAIEFYEIVKAGEWKLVNERLQKPDKAINNLKNILALCGIHRFGDVNLNAEQKNNNTLSALAAIVGCVDYKEWSFLIQNKNIRALCFVAYPYRDLLRALIHGSRQDKKLLDLLEFFFLHKVEPDGIKPGPLFPTYYSPRYEVVELFLKYHMNSNQVIDLPAWGSTYKNITALLHFVLESSYYWSSENFLFDSYSGARSCREVKLEKFSQLIDTFIKQGGDLFARCIRIFPSGEQRILTALDLVEPEEAKNIVRRKMRRLQATEFVKLWMFRRQSTELVHVNRDVMKIVCVKILGEEIKPQRVSIS